MTTFNTLLLDRTRWDLVLDSDGNIALAKPPYALAQDVASAVRLFINELWFDTQKGIPYFEDILGTLPPLSLLTNYIENAALTVPGVVESQCVIGELTDRILGGTIYFIDENGVQNNASF